MRKSISAVLLLNIFLLCGCVRPSTLNIDSFIYDYNSFTGTDLKKTDFCSFVTEEEISYCTSLEDILLTVTSDRKTQEVKRIHISYKNNPAGDCLALAENLIISVSGHGAEIAKEILSDLKIKEFSVKTNYHKAYTFEKKLTYCFLSTDAGNMFYINFNETENITPTEIPTFQKNYMYSETWE